MKILLFVPVFFVLCVLISGGAQTNVKLYESEQGLFSVMLPGSNPQETKTDDGYAQNGQVTSDAGPVTYNVTYTYSCSDLTKPGVRKVVIDDIRKNINAKKDHKIISEEMITPETIVNGRKATFDGYLFVADSNALRITYRLYFALEKVYLLMVLKPKSDLDPPEAAEFFNSFTPVASEHDLSSVKAKFPLGYPGLNEVITKGKAYHLATPIYPTNARIKGLKGKVIVKILINEEGQPTSAVPICGNPELVPASVAAARDSRFQSTLRGNVAIKVTGILTYNYSFSR